MIGGRDALAAFDQRPYFTATIDNGFQTLEHKYYPQKILLKAPCSALLTVGAIANVQLCRAKSARFMAEP
jgi:hypothetical protein